jgi:hypothetical protein
MGYLLFAAFGAADFSLSEQYSIQAAIRESVRAGKQETGRKRIRGRKYLFRGKSNIMIIIRKKMIPAVRDSGYRSGTDRGKTDRRAVKGGTYVCQVHHQREYPAGYQTEDPDPGEGNQLEADR